MQRYNLYLILLWQATRANMKQQRDVRTIKLNVIMGFLEMVNHASHGPQIRLSAQEMRARIALQRKVIQWKVVLKNGFDV